MIDDPRSMILHPVVSLPPAWQTDEHVQREMHKIQDVQIQDTRYVIQDARYTIQDTRCADTRYEIRGTRCKIHDTRYKMCRYKIRDTWYEMQDARCEMQYVRCHVARCHVARCHVVKECVKERKIKKKLLLQIRATPHQGSRVPRGIIVASCVTWHN